MGVLKFYLSAYKRKGLFSKEGVTLNDIRKINRVRQPPDEGMYCFLQHSYLKGLMCDLLWSDPQPFPGRSPNKRGVGVAFGPDVTTVIVPFKQIGHSSIPKGK